MGGFITHSVERAFMGLLRAVRQLLGVSAETAATREADPDDLFELPSATLTMEADLGFGAGRQAGLCVADVDSTAFRDAVEEVQEILTVGESGTLAEFREDSHGYRWIVLEADAFEDLVTGVHYAAKTLVDTEFGSRLQAAVFAFEATDRAGPETGSYVYWVYSFRRGTFYPFVPDGEQSRDQSAELKLSGVLEGELSVENDREYWYPLWPDSPGNQPWE